MDRQHLARLRLATTLLVGPVGGGPWAATSVVDHLVAVQSQEFVVARWSIGERAGVEDAVVGGLLDAGQVLRTHVLRPTWHYVRPADLHWLQELTAPRVMMQLRPYLARYGLDDRTRERFRVAVAAALAGGRSLTRDEVSLVAADAGLGVDRMALSLLLTDAELESVLCSGVTAVPASGRVSGRHHTYALVDDRAPVSPSPPRSRGEAVAELAMRYFTGHGPATIKDFAWWSSLTLSDIRAALAEIGDGLEQVDVEGRTYWGPQGWSWRPAPDDGAHLLQTYDEFVVGYGESRDVLDVAGLSGMTGPEWGRNGHPVVLDGQVVGHWRRASSGCTSLLTVLPTRQVSDAERGQLLDAAGALAAFARHETAIEIADRSVRSLRE